MPDTPKEKPDAMMLGGLIVLHLWRHPKYVVDCKVCQRIKTGRWNLSGEPHDA